MYHPRLQGTHYDMGYKYGDLMYRGGVRFEDAVRLSPEQTEFGLASLDAVNGFYPEIAGELRGMADGLRFSYEAFACYLLTVATSQCIVLADKQGELAVVECCPDRLAVRRPAPGQSFIVATNNFIDPAMIAYDGQPAKNWYLSETRYETAFQALQQPFAAAPMQTAMDILAGKLGFVCQYEKKLRFDTLWSFVVNLKDMTIYRAEGNPGKARFAKEKRFKLPPRN